MPEPTSVSPSSVLRERIWALFGASLLGYYFLVSPVVQMRQNYWLLKDGIKSKAIITKEGWAGHNVVVYRYTVNQREYTGQDFRSWQDRNYALAMPGEKTVIYYSSSHPELSAINMPQRIMVEGLPVMAIAWVFISLLLGTAINPHGRWALWKRGPAGPDVHRVSGK